MYPFHPKTTADSGTPTNAMAAVMSVDVTAFAIAMPLVTEASAVR